MSFAWVEYLTLAEALVRQRGTLADAEACCRAATARRPTTRIRCRTLCHGLTSPADAPGASLRCCRCCSAKRWVGAADVVAGLCHTQPLHRRPTSLRILLDSTGR